jgi:hypothetical protein
MGRSTNHRIVLSLADARSASPDTARLLARRLRCRQTMDGAPILDVL